MFKGAVRPLSFSETLATSLQGLSLLAAVMLFVSLLSPGTVKGWEMLLPFVQRSFFPKVLVVLCGIAGLQLGHIERRWVVPGGSPRRRTGRILLLALLCTSAFLPFLPVSASDDGASPLGVVVTAFYLFLVVILFTGVGYWTAGWIKSEGLGILMRYGILILANVLPLLFFPWLSPLEAVSYAWNRGHFGMGAWTLVGTGCVIVGWWTWRFSSVSFEEFSAGAD
jgi:hypothetical protein